MKNLSEKSKVWATVIFMLILTLIGVFYGFLVAEKIINLSSQVIGDSNDRDTIRGVEAIRGAFRMFSNSLLLYLIAMNLLWIFVVRHSLKITINK
jgi:hypothetical protein